ncbi:MULTISPECIES: SRPBCC family protein [Thermocrispum]|jgi:uncharacterized protein YndB with AHSA1/START domain|uniref:Polyketide cyclase n=1 Tax=Thermocrispum agreste TaxID=37925 RepID=A0A2W4LKS2_9PSEU|nr:MULTISPECIES: SRPBCC family protein [Thermocrispum]PZM96256.1 MAG: polyketide cyclase [Thermocrispum agreste]
MIEVTRTAKAAPERVWALLSDIEKWPALLPTFNQITRLDGTGPIGIGTKFDVRQPGLPKAVYQITDWEPGKLFTWQSQAPGVVTTASHRVEPTADGTRIVLTLDWTGPLARISTLLLGRKARRYVSSEAEHIAQAAEDGEGTD